MNTINNAYRKALKHNPNTHIKNFIALVTYIRKWSIPAVKPIANIKRIVENSQYKTRKRTSVTHRGRIRFFGGGENPEDSWKSGQRPVGKGDRIKPRCSTLFPRANSDYIKDQGFYMKFIFIDVCEIA